MIIFTIAVASSIAKTEPLNHWGSFSRVQGLPSSSKVVDISIENSKKSNKRQYFIRITEKSPDKSTITFSTNSIDCPQFLNVIKSMRVIKIPRLSPYDLSDNPPIVVSDRVSYSLSMPSSDDMGRLTIDASAGSDLSYWVESSLQTLKPCWKVMAAVAP